MTTQNKTEKVHLKSAIKILRDLFWLGENDKAISFCMELPANGFVTGDIEYIPIGCHSER